MKKIYLIASLSISVLFTSAQSVGSVDEHAGHNQATDTKQVTASANAAPIDALEVNASFDFGKIPQGKPVTHNFEVVNIGKTAYKLDNVVASCGCTTPQWDKEKTISAGEKSNITVGFNAASEGPFTKNITITYNGNQTKVITIKGEVWKTPAASAPANATLNDLKN